MPDPEPNQAVYPQEQSQAPGAGFPLTCMVVVISLATAAVLDAANRPYNIAVDADSGLVHTVTTTAANEPDVERIADLLRGKEEQVRADSGYRGALARVDREDLQWHMAARPSDTAKLPEGRRKAAAQKREHGKASVCARGAGASASWWRTSARPHLATCRRPSSRVRHPMARARR